MKVNSKNIKKGLNVLVNDGPITLMKKIKQKKNQNIDIPPKAPTEFLSKVNFEVGKIDIVFESKIALKKIDKILNNLNLNYNIFVFDEEELDDKRFQKINKYTFKNVFSLRSFIYLYQNKECSFANCFNINIDSDVSKTIDELLKTIKGIKLLANYNQKNNISVKTSTFFNYQGTNYYSGGAERYLLDLHEVCTELGINLNVYQHGEKPFFRKYHNINVIGLNLPNETIDYSYNFIDKQTKNYIYHTYYNTNLHIYSAFQECYPNHIGPSIGISHGISWDNKINHYSYGKDFFWENKKIFLEGALFCNKLISVDTNTANWFQTIDYELGNRKFHVIPNYVDTNEFSPRKDYLKIKDKIIITYPRRLYEPRGLYIVLDIIDDILKKYNNVEFHFVGKGFDEDLKNIEKKIKKYPNNIKCYSKAPEEMKEVYKITDISLIPTQYSEGTSLSCLEALSSGNIVVATRIGGLTDLIINNLNGYLIEPSSESLKETIINILDNFDKQEKLRKIGIETAKAFNKNNWKEKWKKEINSFKLKCQSQNNDLIEIYLNDIERISPEILEIIKRELIKGNLLYLRVNKLPICDDFTHDLIQIVSADEEIVNKAKKVYKEKNYLGDINRKDNIEII